MSDAVPAHCLANAQAKCGYGPITITLNLEHALMLRRDLRSQYLDLQAQINSNVHTIGNAFARLKTLEAELDAIGDLGQAESTHSPSAGIIAHTKERIAGI